MRRIVSGIGTILLAAFLKWGDRALSLIGIAGAPDDLTTWERWIRDYGSSVLFLGGVGLLLFGLVSPSASTVNRHRSQMSAPAIGMIIFGVAFVGCLIWWLGSGPPPKENPIEANPLRWSFLGTSPNFLMGKATDYGVEIRGFQAIGKNETGKFLRGVRGHVESPRNGKKYPLYAVHHNELVPLVDHGVPGGNQFMVRAAFFDGAGIPVVRFLSEFGALTFVFEYDGTTYTHPFSAEEVEAQAQWLEEELKPKPKKSEAGVVPLPGRQLSEEQRRDVVETLKGSDWQPDSLWIRYFSPCEECRRYAADLRAAFALAGWNGDFGQTLDQREDLVGLKLHVADLNAKPRTAVLIGLALERASINFDWAPWPEIEIDRTILFAYPRD